MSYRKLKAPSVAVARQERFVRQHNGGAGGAYTSDILLVPERGLFRVTRVQGYVNDALDALLAVDASIARMPHPGPEERTPEERSLVELVHTNTDAGTAKPLIHVDFLAEIAAAGGAARCTWETTGRGIILSAEGGAPEGALRFRFGRTAGPGDIDTAVLLVTYVWVPDGEFPPS